jgi:beta-glucosidase
LEVGTQAAGTAVANVLFGDVNPGGKLPITFPRPVGQLPAYYYHKPSARRGYLFTSDASTTLSMDVTNTGQRAGDEVAQWYMHDVLSERVTRPVKLLKGLQRITLQPGETRTANFHIGREQLQYRKEFIEKVVDPGKFELMVGDSSQTMQTIRLKVL